MQRHNLCSPSSTYYVIPSVTLLNGKKNVTSLNLKNPVIMGNLPRHERQGMSSPVNVHTEKSNLTCHPASYGRPSGGRKGQPAQNRREPATSVPTVSTPKRQETAPEGNAGTVSQIARVENGEYVSESSTDSDSSVSELPTKGFFESHRLPYSAKEDEEILRFVLVGGNIRRTLSLSLWRELETKKEDPRRTYQSLKNRFLRNIKPRLFTHFRHMLNDDAIAQIKVKFPELKHSRKCTDLEVQKHKGNSIPQLQKTGPRQALPSSLTEIEPSSSLTRAKLQVPRLPCQIRTFRDIAVGDDKLSIEDRVRSGPDSSPAKKADMLLRKKDAAPEVAKKDAETITDVVITNNSEEDSTPGRTVQIFAQEKLQHRPVQTFQYSKIVESFRDKVNLNLNLVLVGDGVGVSGCSQSLLSRADPPLKIDVSVVISSERRGAKRAAPAEKAKVLRPLTSSATTKKVRRRKAALARIMSDKDLRNRYLLRLKRHNFKKVRTMSKEYKQMLAELLTMLKEDESTESQGSSQSSSQRQETSSAAESNEPVAESNGGEERAEGNSQEMCSSVTNCSTEDESCYNEVYRKVSRIYQVVMDMEPVKDGEGSKERKDAPVESSVSPTGNSDSSPTKRKPNALVLEYTPKKNPLLSNMLEMFDPAEELLLESEEVPARNLRPRNKGKT